MVRRAVPPPPGDSPRGGVRLTALRLLARRDYSAAELAARLLARGHRPDEVDTAVEALRRERAVDDERLARAHVRTSGTLKGRGRLRVRRELEARGIARDVVDAALAGWDPADERETVARLIARQTGPGKLSKDDRRRLVQRLRRRGFTTELILSVLGGRSDDES